MFRIDIKRIIYYSVTAVLIVLLSVIVAKRAKQQSQGDIPGTGYTLSSGSEILVPVSEPSSSKVNYGVYISEVMPKNRAVFRDENGDFPDYIELHNDSDSVVDLSGWGLSDKGKSRVWYIGSGSIAPREYLIIYADGKGSGFHTSFSLSDDETVSLFDAEGEIVSSLSCGVSQSDAVMIQDSEGNCEESLYPTPGLPNTQEGYEAYQNTLIVRGPLSINEVVVSNLDYTFFWEIIEKTEDDKKTEIRKPHYYDWIEVKNTSGSAVLLSEYYLSDSSSDFHKWRFPEYSLNPGEIALVFCNSDGWFGPNWKTSVWDAQTKYVFCNFSLDSLHDKLFLSHGEELADYVSLKDIPINCSIGRLAGENGFFYFDNPSPFEDNTGGYRYVASKPVSLTSDGVFDGSENITVELSAKGDIFYTLDGSVPTENSLRYSGPFSVNETSIVRAVSVEPGAMISRPITLSYIINEGCSMPIVSLVVDDADAFGEIVRKAYKYSDVSANVAFYEEDGSFNMGCTVKLTGDASLTQSYKRGMRVKFNGAFGADMLHYDLFEGGVSDFSALSLRTGNDNILTYVRNEVAQDLGLEFSDNVISQHGRYCILYINGEYQGIYCLKEKINRQYIATIEGVSKNSVEVTEMADVLMYNERNAFYRDVYSFVIHNDMSVPENYERLCELIDVDSFIDWFVLQGQCGNWDMIYRNISFYRSSETDGKWRMLYYDLDRAYMGGYNDVCVFSNVFSYNWKSSNMIPVNKSLMKNDEYREKFITRCAQAVTTVFTDDNMLKILDRRQAEVAPEVERDCTKWGLSYATYQKLASELRDYIQYHDISKNGYCEYSIKQICGLLNISRDEFLTYAK